MTVRRKQLAPKSKSKRWFTLGKHPKYREYKVVQSGGRETGRRLHVRPFGSGIYHDRTVVQHDDRQRLEDGVPAVCRGAARRRPLLRRGQPPWPDRLALHAAGLRPRAAVAERADAGRHHHRHGLALCGLWPARLRAPAPAGPHRQHARSPAACEGVRGLAAFALAGGPRGIARAADPRPRPDQELRLRHRADRLLRPAVAAVLPHHHLHAASRCSGSWRRPARCSACF